MREVNFYQVFSTFPIFDLKIDGRRIFLRELRESDAKMYYEIYNDESVANMMVDEDVPNSIEEAKNSLIYWSGLFNKKQSFFWGISDEDDDSKLIGSIGLMGTNFHNRRTEISYDVHKDYRRIGIASAAMKEVLNFAFFKLAMYRIEARTMIENELSQHLLKKNSFKLEGIQRNYRFSRGSFIDVTLYSCILKDFCPLFTKR